MKRGLPPSIDRTIQKRQMMVTVAFFAIVIPVAAFFFTRIFSGTSESFDYSPSQPNISSGTSTERTELVSANKAVEQAVIARFGRQNLDAIEWLDRRHQGHLGSYHFEGRVQIEDSKGQEGIFNYTVDLELSSDKTWRVQAITVERK